VAEKWVVVELYSDYSGVIDIHGIFESDYAAHTWARDQYFMTYEVKRIRRAVTEEWA
jgi:hypothetical protein